jgi:hypothetical protein
LILREKMGNVLFLVDQSSKKICFKTNIKKIKKKTIF